MYKEDLTLNNLQWLICHKTQSNPTKQNKTKSLSFSLSLYIYLSLACKQTPNYVYLLIAAHKSRPPQPEGERNNLFKKGPIYAKNGRVGEESNVIK